MRSFLRFMDRMFGALGVWFQSPILLILRVYFGIGFVIAGAGKFQDIAHFQNSLISLQVPYPEVAAWAVAFTETICGTLLILGLLSRLASIPLIVVMSVAYATAHVDAIRSITKEPHLFVSQAPFNFLLTALLVFAFGPGFFSLDRWLGGPTVKPSEPKK